MSDKVKVMTLPELDESVPDEELKLGTMFCRETSDLGKTETNWFVDSKECLEWFRKEAERHDWKLIRVTFDGKVVYEIPDEHAPKSSSHLKNLWKWKDFHQINKCVQCGKEFRKNSPTQMFCSEECYEERRRERERRRYWEERGKQL